MKAGVFAVARNIFEHEFFADEPLTEREAWIWLIREAAWKERRVRAGKALVNLQRGQCAFSVRFLAEAWGWSKSKAHRFLTRLEGDAMIGTDVGQGVMVVTICNYDEYQRVSLPKETDDGTEAGQKRDTSGTNEKTGENIKNNTPSGAQAPFIDFSNPTEAQLYAFGKFVLGKSAGGVITNLLKKCERDFVYAASWLAQAREKENPMEWIQGVIRSAEMLVWRGVDGGPKPSVDFKTREERAYEDDWRNSPTWAGVDI